MKLADHREWALRQMSDTTIESRSRITAVWAIRYYKNEKTMFPSRTVFYSCEAEADAAAEAAKWMEQEGAVRIEICRVVLKNPPPFGEARLLD
jgi:2-methylcitrate dehydratase PrpD